MQILPFKTNIMTKYILLKSNAQIVSNYDGFGLENKQKAVGGLIQPVSIEEGMTAYVNEEGLLKDLPENHIASINFRNNKVFDRYIFEGNRVLGNVLFECKSKAQYKLLKVSLEFAERVMRLENNIIESKF